MPAGGRSSRAAAAHVPRADEGDGKLQSRAEEAGEDVDILRRGDAPRSTTSQSGRLARAMPRALALERGGNTRRCRVDVPPSERHDRGARDERVRAAQPALAVMIESGADDRIVRFRRPTTGARSGPRGRVLRRLQPEPVGQVLGVVYSARAAAGGHRLDTLIVERGREGRTH